MIVNLLNKLRIVIVLQIDNLRINNILEINYKIYAAPLVPILVVVGVFLQITVKLLGNEESGLGINTRTPNAIYYTVSQKNLYTRKSFV